jgi:hypothetical protein
MIHILVFSVDAFDKQEALDHNGNSYKLNYLQNNVLNKKGVELYGLNNFIIGLNEQRIDVENSWIASITIV